MSRDRRKNRGVVGGKKRERKEEGEEEGKKMRRG